MRLTNCTFCLGDKPMRNLMWCDTVPKAKRNKPAKINGVLVSQVQAFYEL